MSPNHINSYDSVTSIVPNPMNSKGFDGHFADTGTVYQSSGHARAPGKDPGVPGNWVYPGPACTPMVLVFASKT